MRPSSGRPTIRCSSQFAEVLTKNVLLHQAGRFGRHRRSPRRSGAMLRAAILTRLDTLKAEMELNGPDLTDSTISRSEREKIGGSKVEKYFDGLVGGKIRLRPLPSALGQCAPRESCPTRSTMPASTARWSWPRSKRAQADSAAGGGGMRPAPGGPPMPGALPPRRRDAQCRAAVQPAARCAGGRGQRQTVNRRSGMPSAHRGPSPWRPWRWPVRRRATRGPGQHAAR